MRRGERRRLLGAAIAVLLFSHGAAYTLGVVNHETDPARVEAATRLDIARQLATAEAASSDTVQGATDRGELQAYGPADCNLPAWTPPAVAAWRGDICGAAEHYRLDVDLLTAMITLESAGDPNATSSAGAKGLTQVMDATAADIHPGCVAMPYDGSTSIWCGAYYLAEQVKAFGSPLTAIAAYSCGPGCAAAGPPYPRETRNYMEKVGRLLALQ